MLALYIKTQSMWAMKVDLALEGITINRVKSRIAWIFTLQIKVILRLDVSQTFKINVAINIIIKNNKK